MAPTNQAKSILTQVPHNELRPRITVVGVGGAGGNAVNNMIRAKLEGVEFLIANTDAQAIEQSAVESARRIQLGLNITQGLGAGSKPDVGRAAAEESMEEVIRHIAGSNMVFITAGMGGGTGTGAAPVIARAARESGILTVGVVTKPFHFEGTHRLKTAERGIEELQQYVDTLIVIPNQNLFRVANERTTFADAFKMADDVLYSGVRGVTDLMMMPGLINLDFADIRAVMAEMGKAMMGTGEAEGDRRALDASEAAISNPLLDDVSMKGARGVLINITGGYDMTLYEVDEAANRIREEVDPEANIIFGSTFDEKLNGIIRVSVVATGIGFTIPKGLMKPQNQSSPNIFPMHKDESQQMTSSHSQQSFSSHVSHESFDDQHSNSTQMPMNFNNDSSHPMQQTPHHELNTHGLTTTQNQPQQPHEEVKRPSLFERFTGVSRASNPAPQSAPAPTRNHGNEAVKTEDTKEQQDLLEIPAFLRR
jgi:cell division protein FtsZ